MSMLFGLLMWELVNERMWETVWQALRQCASLECCTLQTFCMPGPATQSSAGKEYAFERFAGK